MNYYNNETILEQQKQIENLTTALQKVSDYNLRLESQLSDERMKNLRLETERDALAAKLYRMSTFIKLSAKKWEGVPEVEPTFWNLLRVVDETQYQSLAEIRAYASKDGFMACVDAFNLSQAYMNGFSARQLANDYADKIRQGGTL